MNPEIKAKWVEALRSGKYPQATGMLRTNDDRFCCLGVLCNIAEQEGVVVAERDTYGGDDEEVEGFSDWRYGNSTTDLPYSVMQWAGLGAANPMLGDESAVTLNDELEYTFEQIADRVEETL